MNYQINIKRIANKALGNLSEKDYQKVINIIKQLGENPRPFDCLKLTGRDGWRIRVGSYRIVYQINDEKKLVTIINFGHRKDIYR